MSLSVSLLIKTDANVKPRAVLVGSSRENNMRSAEIGMGTQRHPPVKRLVHELVGNCLFYCSWPMQKKS